MITTLATIFVSSFLLALSGALMPGPLLTVTISETPKRGFLTGPLMILGHGILELSMVVALFCGLAPILLRDDVFISISLVGGSILLWMASTMLRELPTLQLNGVDTQGNERNLVLSGIMLSIANPYWFIWWATIGLGYILYSAGFGLSGVISFYLGHILADLMWYAAVSFGISRGKKVLSDTWYRRLIGGCALFLVGFSCFFFYSGLHRLIA